MTEDVKHTPGPWECQTGHSDWGMLTAHVIVPEGETGNDYETWIAEVPSITPYCMGASRKDKERASSQLANARLIAAAPDMLAALSLLHKWFEVTGSSIHTRWDRIPTADRKAIVDATRAAIAKATN